MSEARYIPPLRFHALTPLYDAAVRLLVRDRTLKTRVVSLLAPRPLERILDLGCGTGTLAILIKRTWPETLVIGVDIDRQALDIAARKASHAGTQVSWRHGSVTEPPFPEASFDTVVSSLVFHHLRSEEKSAALGAILRLLVPGGRLLLVDYGRSASPLLRLLFGAVRRLDGAEPTEDHALGRIPALVHAAGFRGTEELERLDTPTGTITFLSAVKPGTNRP